MDVLLNKFSEISSWCITSLKHGKSEIATMHAAAQMVIAGGFAIFFLPKFLEVRGTYF
jgi:hypothetical protein